MDTRRFSVPEPDHRLSDADRAKLVQAFGARAVGEEWAVRYPDGRIEATQSRQMAERLAHMLNLNGQRTRPGAVVVRRTVSPWTEVDA